MTRWFRREYGPSDKVYTDGKQAMGVAAGGANSGMPLVDLGELHQAWNRRFPGRRPIGHELTGVDAWVRFHTLPESKRYAESPAEAAEILRRHNVLIDELVSLSNEESLVIVLSAYSPGHVAAPLNAVLRSTAREARLWQSVLREVDEDIEFWNHLYVQTVRWRVTVLDGLLQLVAEDKARDVIVAPLDFKWLYHPYDGGADVIAVSSEQRDELQHVHSDWLAQDPQGQ